jgi:RNA recognition motif-containing protein
MQDRNTGRSRGFGFVTFDSEQTVEDILTLGKTHEFDGKEVTLVLLCSMLAFSP